MALTRVGYKKLGAAAARNGENLVWFSEPTAWQEKARKEVYEAERAVMREEKSAHLAAMAQPVEVNGKGKPMRKRRQAILRATEEDIKVSVIGGKATTTKTPSLREKGKEIHDKITNRKPRAEKPSVESLEGEVQDLNARISGMQGALNATRQSVESSKARNEQLQTIIDGQKLDISRLERQRTYERQKKAEQSATEAANARSLADGFTMLQVLSPMLSTARQKATLGAVMAYLRQINPELGQERIEPEPKPVATLFKDRVFVPGDEVAWNVGDRHYEGIVKYRPHIEPGMVEVLGRATRDGKTILSPKPELSMAQVRAENLRLMKPTTGTESPGFVGVAVKKGDSVRFRPGGGKAQNPIHVGEVVEVSEGSVYVKVLARPVDGSQDDDKYPQEFIVYTNTILTVEAKATGSERKPQFEKFDLVTWADRHNKDISYTGIIQTFHELDDAPMCMVSHITRRSSVPTNGPLAKSMEVSLYDLSHHIPPLTKWAIGDRVNCTHGGLEFPATVRGVNQPPTLNPYLIVERYNGSFYAISESSVVPL